MFLCVVPLSASRCAVHVPTFRVALQKSWRAQSGTEQLEGWKSSLCGSVAGGIAAGITTPLDVAKTRIVLSRDASMSIVKVLKEVAAKEGVKGLFSGVVPRVAWISVGGAVFFGSYEYSKQFIGALLASS